MKTVIFFCMLPFELNAAQLILGQVYDFDFRDGQDIRGATLISESDVSYSVKIMAVDEILIIEKRFLLESPKLSQNEIRQPGIARLQSGIAYVSGDANFIGGKLSTYERFFPSFSLTTFYFLDRLRFLGVRALATGFSYALLVQDARRIDIITIGLGPAWIFGISKKNLASPGYLAFFLLLKPTISMILYKSYTFNATDYVPGASLDTGVLYYVNLRLVVTLSAAASYLYDRNIPVVTGQIRLGVGFGF